LTTTRKLHNIRLLSNSLNFDTHETEIFLQIPIETSPVRYFSKGGVITEKGLRSCGLILNNHVTKSTRSHFRIRVSKLTNPYEKPHAY